MNARIGLKKESKAVMTHVRRFMEMMKNGIKNGLID